MEDAFGNADNDVVEQEESTNSIPSPLFLGPKPKKRLTSKVWDDFVPSFVNGKLAHAECMHCHRVFNCGGTSSLWNHQARCSPSIQAQKRPKLHGHASLPSTQKNTTAAVSDPKQKRLPILLSSHKKDLGTAGAVPELELAAPDTPANTNKRNQEVDQSRSHEKLAAPKQNNLAVPVVSTDKDKKNQGIDKDISHEELVRTLAMHGHATRMVEQDDFGLLVAHLNPAVKIPSHIDLMMKTFDLFQQEKSKLKDRLAALHTRVCLSAYMWNYDPHLAFLCLSVHYIDDEWEKQQKIITFSPMDPSCDAKESSNVILGAIREWGLHDKVFSIIVDALMIQ